MSGRQASTHSASCSGRARPQPRRFLQHLRHAPRQPLRLFAGQAGPSRPSGTPASRAMRRIAGEKERTVRSSSSKRRSRPPMSRQPLAMGSPALKHRHVGRAPADVRFDHPLAAGARKLRRAGPAARENALQRRAGGCHHKIPRQAGEGLRDRPRILLARGFAGDDDRTQPDLLRTDARRRVVLADDALDRLASMVSGSSAASGAGARGRARAFR